MNGKNRNCETFVVFNLHTKLQSVSLIPDYNYVLFTQVLDESKTNRPSRQTDSNTFELITFCLTFKSNNGTSAILRLAESYILNLTQV